MNIPTPLLLLGLSLLHPLDTDRGPYLTAAREAARWIRAATVETEQGAAWPSDPCDRKSVDTSLYAGTAGVTLFFLELYYATGDHSYLNDARRGADYLLAKIPQEHWHGFYVGTAGVGFALEETFQATREAKYREGARQRVRIIKAQAQRKDEGVEWDETTDIISGSAGTGLFLLYAARRHDDPSARDLAVQAGRRLLQLGQPAGPGSQWIMHPKVPRVMPNFSHGTAGVAYFLASLHAETKEEAFLAAALAGARYLQSIAMTSDKTCLIFHHEPDGKDLYYLGWCHGPAGTARLFYRLYQITGKEEWMDWVFRCARAELTSGIPERRTAGFWNNVSRCCGSAAVAEFMLDLHRITGKREYSDLAMRMTEDVLERATFGKEGLSWNQAEFRIRPDYLVAQTGYMQGASGIGMWLLHLDLFARGEKPKIVLPDNPF